jgi:hypothetical protein
MTDDAGDLGRFNPSRCSACGVTAGRMHEDDCAVMAAVARWRDLARGARPMADPDIHTEESPREPSQLIADVLDVVEQLDKLERTASFSPNWTDPVSAPHSINHDLGRLRWQVTRLARQVAEIAQHVAVLAALHEPPTITIPEGTYLGDLDESFAHYDAPAVDDAEITVRFGPRRDFGEAASFAEINEGLSRAVIAGIVKAWHMDGASGGYWIQAADAKESRRYSAVEASAFADAVFAAEVALLGEIKREQ